MMTERELKHFGVLGMKWGVSKGSGGSSGGSRRTAAQLAKADKKWDKNVNKHFEKATKEINKDPNYKAASVKMAASIVKDKKFTNDYDREQEYQKRAIPLVNKYLDNTPEATSPSGKKKIQVKEVKNAYGVYMKVYTTDK